MGRLFDSKQFRTDLQLSGSFSGSFTGDGSSLTNVPATGIVGLNLSQIGSGSATASISPDNGLHVNTSISASIISSSILVTAPTGSFKHLITDDDTIEFRNKSTGVQTGRLKFDSENGLNVQDSAGGRTRIKAGFGKFLQLESFSSFNSIGPLTASIISASSTIFANDIEAFRMNVTHLTSSFITASTIETSGSNIFGDESSDTHTFVGDIIAQNNISSSGYISASNFVGDGSGLINIPASGITGLNLSQIASGSVTASISPDKGLVINTNISASGYISASHIHLTGGENSVITVPNSTSGFTFAAAGGNSTVDIFGTDFTSNLVKVPIEGKFQINSYNTILGRNYLQLYSTAYLTGTTAGYFTIAGSTGTSFNIGARLGVIGTTNDDAASAFKVQNSDSVNILDIVNDKNIRMSGSLELTGSLNVSGSYIGDGNNITNISPSNITYGNNIAIGGTVTDTYGNAIGKSATAAGQAIAIGGFSNAAFGAVILGQSTIGGQYTVAIGIDAGHTSGQYNVLLGYRAGKYSSGNYNIAFGHLAGFDQTSGTGNITIGSGSRGVAGESNQLRIGHGSHGALISGSLSDGGVMIQGQVSASSYIGDGSGLTGLGGAYGISNSNGVYTYYATLSASIAAASTGDVVEVFADVTETNPVTILFKNGVNIQGNGHKYTLDHTGSQAAFADYLSTETSGTSISSSINNLQIDRINGDASTGLRAATIYINNDTANHDTFLDLRGSEISNNTSDTYYCSYRHGRVLGGKFIGNHNGRYFISAAQVQYTGTHNLTDVYCESEDGYAQVDDAGNSTFVSKNNTAALVTQGDFVGCTFVSNASSPSQNGAAVTQVGSISGAKLKNCNVWCNGSGTTAVYGVAWIENCTIVNARYYALNYAIDTGGAQSFTLLNSSIYSNAGSAIKVQDGSNTGTLRILNNTIHNDRYSTYGAYPTMYLQGWDNSDTLISNNTIVHGGPYKSGNLANAIEVHSGGGSNYTFNIVNNTIKVSQYDAFCISSSAAVAPNIVYAQNTFEGANVPVAPSITQTLTNVPDAQGNIHVTSSLDNSRIYSGSFSGSYVGDGTGLTGVEAFPFSGSAVITGSLTVSGSVVDFMSASAVNLDIESIPLVNPMVEYVNCGAITSSGTTVPLPNNLTFVSSSVYEYIEIFINGLRMRYDVDFMPASTSTIKYFVTIPSGSEITYKSLKRP